MTNMDNQTNEIIEKIIYLPLDFKHQNKSVGTLLHESGYFEVYSQINEDKIFTVLKSHPEFIKVWLQWSEDKRSSGWYFTKGDDGECFVGHYPQRKEFEEIKSFDEFRACAAFIKREIEDIRKT